MILNVIISLIDKLSCFCLPTNNDRIRWVKIVVGWELIEKAGLYQTGKLLKQAEEMFWKHSITHDKTFARFMVHVDELNETNVIHQHECVCYLLLLNDYVLADGLTLEKHITNNAKMFNDVRYRIFRKTSYPCMVIAVVPVRRKSEISGKEICDYKLIVPYIFGHGPV
jgi:hypothetical protein